MDPRRSPDPPGSAGGREVSPPPNVAISPENEATAPVYAPLSGDCTPTVSIGSASDSS